MSSGTTVGPNAASNSNAGTPVAKSLSEPPPEWHQDWAVVTRRKLLIMQIAMFSLLWWVADNVLTWAYPILGNTYVAVEEFTVIIITTTLAMMLLPHSKLNETGVLIMLVWFILVSLFMLACCIARTYELDVAELGFTDPTFQIGITQVVFDWFFGFGAMLADIALSIDLVFKTQDMLVARSLHENLIRAERSPDIKFKEQIYTAMLYLKKRLDIKKPRKPDGTTNKIA